MRKFKIKLGAGMKTWRVYMDGEEQKNLVSIEVTADIKNAPILKLGFRSLDVEIEGDGEVEGRVDAILSAHLAESGGP